MPVEDVNHTHYVLLDDGAVELIGVYMSRYHGPQFTGYHDHRLRVVEADNDIPPNVPKAAYKAACAWKRHALLQQSWERQTSEPARCESRLSKCQESLEWTFISQDDVFESLDSGLRIQARRGCHGWVEVVLNCPKGPGLRWTSDDTPVSYSRNRRFRHVAENPTS